MLTPLNRKDLIEIDWDIQIQLLLLYESSKTTTAFSYCGIVRL